jgi:hypothetical protein
MKPFDYLVVLVAILIGLAIADLVFSTHRLLRAARRVKWHWAAPACAVLALLAVLRTFWVFWNRHAETSMTLASFLPIVGALVLMFLAAAAALPDEISAEGLDLKVFYLGNRRHFWGVTVLWLMTLVAINYSLALARGIPLSPAVAVLNVVVVAISISLMVVRRLWWHAVGIAVLLAGIAWQWLPLAIG